ncbi:DM13 domain-containing protein [Leptolyngbya sp. FACHB-541]|uniref:DM13 domain-containing protein n=1 Tax=Leptolyngbya sp. FACHB-541 TaxID=2692810 RepID=UPI00168990EB|nr:DM13 domain-containing protein [Leptolyngbya sp. FACHB-541]MBD2000074.1 DM13 domain-containing protein [Leptolyngbya sp. FACHB-541]
MKFAPLSILASFLILSVGCAEQAVEQPVSETASPSPNAEVTASTDAPAALEASTKSGTFVPGEAPTEGMVQIVTENGERYLELDESFKTSDQGPDLFVILHRSDDVLATTEPPAYPLQEGDYVILAPLEEFTGAQRYLIPEEVNLDDYKSAAIWCRQFNATFGVAKFEG